MPLHSARAAVQVEVPLTTSKVRETLGAIEGRKEYYLKKRQSIKDGTYDAEKDPEAHSKKSPPRENGATTSYGPTANGDVSEEFEHVSYWAYSSTCHYARTLWHHVDALWHQLAGGARGSWW